MERRSLPMVFGALFVVGTCAAIHGCDGDSGVAVTRAPLRAECVPAEQSPPEDAFVCPDDLVVQCDDGSGSADVEVLYVPAGDDGCDEDGLTVSDPGPFGPGSHTIEVRDSNAAAVCEATLIVEDQAPPEVTPHTLFLWPPNHKFHSISVEDCVSAVDACEGELRGEFIWGSSDEPIDDLGDGHHMPDILFDDCQHVQVRAERQGPIDGRVYRLGVRVVDGAGNATESECTIVVDHDQRGVDGVDSGESYRVELDGSDGLPECDGRTGDPQGGGDDDSGPPEGDNGGAPLPGDGPG